MNNGRTSTDARVYIRISAVPKQQSSRIYNKVLCGGFWQDRVNTSVIVWFKLCRVTLCVAFARCSHLWLCCGNLYDCWVLKYLLHCNFPLLSAVQSLLKLPFHHTGFYVGVIHWCHINPCHPPYLDKEKLGKHIDSLPSFYINWILSTTTLRLPTWDSFPRHRHAWVRILSL